MESDRGTVTGTHGVDVVMKEIGIAQVYWGKDIGVLWEAILYGDIQQRDDFEAIANQLWGICERTLQAQGVRRIFTYNRDNEYAEEWYQDFLKRQRYSPIAGKEYAVVKSI